MEQRSKFEGVFMTLSNKNKWKTSALKNFNSSIYYKLSCKEIELIFITLNLRDNCVGLSIPQKLCFPRCRKLKNKPQSALNSCNSWPAGQNPENESYKRDGNAALLQQVIKANIFLFFRHSSNPTECLCKPKVRMCINTHLEFVLHLVFIVPEVLLRSLC